MLKSGEKSTNLNQNPPPDDASSEHSSENNNSNNSSRKSASSRRNWTSGNFDLIEVFDDEQQLQEWFNGQGGGGDWVTECKRETRTHHVTEFICRFSHKYSSRRVPDTPYNCPSRLRIRRPITLDIADQSITVEKTAADHDHEPKESGGSDNRNRTTNEQQQQQPSTSQQATTAESSGNEPVLKAEKLQDREKSSSADLLQIDEEYGDFEVENPPPPPNLQAEGKKPESSEDEIAPAVKELILEKAALGWDARRIQNFMMTERLNAPTVAQICALLDAQENSKLAELLEKKKLSDQHIKECTEKVSELGKRIAESFEQQRREQQEEEEDVQEEIETVNETLEEVEEVPVPEREEEMDVEEGKKASDEPELLEDDEQKQLEGKKASNEPVLLENDEEKPEESKKASNQPELLEDEEEKPKMEVDEGKKPSDEPVLLEEKEKPQKAAELLDQAGRLEEKSMDREEVKVPKAELDSELSEHEVKLARRDVQKRQREEPETQESRPKRNRTRRLYSPSPPPRMGGEPKRKKERSEDYVPVPMASAHAHSHVLIPKRIPWAKEPPRQSHSDQPATLAALVKQRAAMASSSSSLGIAGGNGGTKLSTPMPFHTQTRSMAPAPVPPFVPQTPDTTNLVRQNEKLTRELVQLKRLNQEQQQQIQALISANRELIWAFNESRREHEELMKQLRLLTGTGGAVQQQKQLVNGTGTRGGGGHGNVPSAGTKSAHFGGQKRLAMTPSGAGRSRGGGGGRRGNKGKTGSSMVLMPSMLPPSLAMLSKKTPARQQVQAVHPPGNPSMNSVNDQLLATVKQEIEEHREEEGIEPSQFQADQLRLSKPDQIEQIKQQLYDLPTSPAPEVGRLLGSRRPAFFTPKESGDWHMVVPSDLRRQLIFQLFQALCPEFKQRSVEDYLAVYPSRKEYLHNSVEYAFKTENELFVEAPSREAYLQLVASKIYALLDAHYRYSDAGKEKRKTSTVAATTTKRTLADLLKPKRSRPVDEVEQQQQEEGEEEGGED